ncbi:hypothetical protein LSTR_LSTR013739 [Laodelphax striatellus]|uniref:Uncharacterized protein n=1 Tax=Laodelphax striatellus TaxID=195883 RepID=A0A482WMV4_LAOST|nr:hypothetical protein LSTR_LSTR013739 [Laodelphax striatellus]
MQKSSKPGTPDLVDKSSVKSASPTPTETKSSKPGTPDLADKSSVKSASPTPTESKTSKPGTPDLVDKSSVKSGSPTPTELKSSKPGTPDLVDKSSVKSASPTPTELKSSKPGTPDLVDKSSVKSASPTPTETKSSKPGTPDLVDKSSVKSASPTPTETKTSKPGTPDLVDKSSVKSVSPPPTESKSSKPGSPDLLDESSVKTGPTQADSKLSKPGSPDPVDKSSVKSVSPTFAETKTSKPGTPDLVDKSSAKSVSPVPLEMKTPKSITPEPTGSAASFLASGDKTKFDSIRASPISDDIIDSEKSISVTKVFSPTEKMFGDFLDSASNVPTRPTSPGDIVTGVDDLGSSTISKKVDGKGLETFDESAITSVDESSVISGSAAEADKLLKDTPTSQFSKQESFQTSSKLYDESKSEKESSSPKPITSSVGGIQDATTRIIDEKDLGVSNTLFQKGIETLELKDSLPCLDRALLESVEKVTEKGEKLEKEVEDLSLFGEKSTTVYGKISPKSVSPTSLEIENKIGLGDDYNKIKPLTSSTSHTPRSISPLPAYEIDFKADMQGKSDFIDLFHFSHSQIYIPSPSI